MENNFIFVDSESNSDKSIKDMEIQTFKLGCGIFWKRDINETSKKVYYNTQNFWIDVDNCFNTERSKWFLFAHNTWYDFKMLNGFKHLFDLGWKLTRNYIRNRVCILTFKKDKYTLNIYDTYNYIPMKLKAIGKSLKLDKLEVNFNDVSLKDLEIYCMRDTEIIFLLIKELTNFLEIHKLSSLRATIASLAMSSFKHRFYNPIKDKKDTKIVVHNWKRAIKLERESYYGGITDCYAIGKYKKAYKMDINSQYPYNMKKHKVPVNLEGYIHDKTHTQKELFKIWKSYKYKNGFIMDVLVDLPKENAYILKKFKDKSRFVYGKFRIALCSPELKFIEKYGKILHIYQLNFYTMRNIFKDYVEFFNALKIKYDKQNNQAFRMFAKFFMNTLYGKFAQRKVDYKQLKKTDKEFKKYSGLIYHMIENKQDLIDKNEPIIYFGNFKNHFELYMINGQLWTLKQTTDNDKDSFVGISSFITSYSRMLLVDYLKIAKRENSYYSDTDSIIVNRKGCINLIENNCIDNFKLGKLKCEGFGNTEILKPKFYRFNDELKCKGVKKDSKILLEDNIKIVYEVNNWSQYKSDLKKGISNKQLIKKGKKEILKTYDKGKVLPNNRIEAFSFNELHAYT